MAKSKEERIGELVERLPHLTDGQLQWVGRVLDIFDLPHQFEVHQSDLFDDETLQNFGDALRIHHSFSNEAFTKDKFEYVFEKVLNMSGHEAALASRGNRGHDITVDGTTISLKTQANRNIRTDRIWISKFMELGGGNWGDDPDDLIGLRDSYLAHLQGYDRVFTLRTLRRAPDWFYELVEIPKVLLESAADGELEMKLDGRQFPKPGYCYVPSRTVQHFQLYFDGGGERKLQIKNLEKSECKVHATWGFRIPPE